MQALPTAAPVSYPGAQGRLPLPLDDDPLTSPSFPAINTSDSRSYRTQQGRGQQSGNSGGYSQPPPQNGNSGGYSQPPPQYPQAPTARFPAAITQGPASQYSGYPATADHSASQPGGYQNMPAAASRQAAGYQQPVSAPPAANTYVNYGNPPQPGYQGTPNGQSTGYGYAGTGSYQDTGQQALPDAAWYSADAVGHDQSHTSAISNGSEYSANDPAAADYRDVSFYAPAAYQGEVYPAAFQGGGYPVAGQPEPASYAPHGQLAGPYDQRGYSSPEQPYGRDGYQAYPGYGGNGH